MADILQTTFFKCILLIVYLQILAQMSTTFVPKDPITIRQHWFIKWRGAE